MKKQLIVIIIVLAMLAAFTGTAAAAPLASGSATLVSVVFVPGKGPVFTFEVSGEFSKSDLEGFVQVDGGGQFGLYCTQVDAHTVTCTTSKKAAGQNVTLSWGGAIFWASVPVAKDPAPPYCYSIWDWWEFTNNEWTDFGPYCQDTPAQAGDDITYTVVNPNDPNQTYEGWAIFFEDDVSSECEETVPYYGPAYYYPFCPF